MSGALAYYTTLSSTNACIYNLSGNNASFYSVSVANISIGNASFLIYASIIGSLSVGVNACVTGNGYFNNIYSGYSDDRLKINKSNIINCVEKIKPLNVFFYYPNTSLLSQYGIKNIPYEQDIGISTHEVLPIFLELVCEAPFDINIDKKTGHHTSKTGLDLLSVRYDCFVPILLQAIKELDERVFTIEKHFGLST